MTEGARTQTAVQRHVVSGSSHRARRTRGMETLETVCGLCCASFFSVMYYCVPLYIVATVVYASRTAMRMSAMMTEGDGEDSSPTRDGTILLLLLLPIIVSAAMPTRALPDLFMTKAMWCVQKYFKYSEILELDDMSLYEHTTKVKPVIIAASPHGVISMGGLCTLVYDFQDGGGTATPRRPQHAGGRGCISSTRSSEYARMSAREKHLFRLHGLFAQLPTAAVNALRLAPVLKARSILPFNIGTWCRVSYLKSIVRQCV